MLTLEPNAAPTPFHQSARDLVGERSVKPGSQTFNNGEGTYQFLTPAIVLKLVDVFVIGTSEYGEVILKITPEQYEYLNDMQSEVYKKVSTAMRKKKIPTAVSWVRQSAQTGTHYVKVKIRGGNTRTPTIGVPFGENSPVKSILPLLNGGNRGTFALSVEGMYVSANKSGLMVKLDMFKITQLPSEEESNTKTAPTPYSDPMLRMQMCQELWLPALPMFYFWPVDGVKELDDTTWQNLMFLDALHSRC